MTLKMYQSYQFQFSNSVFPSGSPCRGGEAYTTNTNSNPHSSNITNSTSYIILTQTTISSSTPSTSVPAASPPPSTPALPLNLTHYQTFLLRQGEVLSHSRRIVVPRTLGSQARQLVTRRVPVADQPN
jgi:hypothetical protein